MYAEEETDMMLITLLAENETCIELTLFDLVQAVSEITADEYEVAATVEYMLNTGRVRLVGEFREPDLLAC